MSNNVLLKTTYWQQNAEKLKERQEWKYDSDLDMLYIYFTPTKEDDRIIVKSLDRNVKLLSRNSDNEVIGMSIESFKDSFLPMYTNREWRFTNTGTYLKDVRDIIIEGACASPIRKPISKDKNLARRVILKPLFTLKVSENSSNG